MSTYLLNQTKNKLNIELILIGLTPLEYHLTPRVKGIELVLENLGDSLDAFYNITTLFEDKTNFLSKKSWKRSLPGMFGRNLLSFGE